jgi:hypothetical protein
MTNISTSNTHLVSDEIDDHKTEVNEWISKIQTLEIPTNRKGVSDRFVRDCQTLLTDLDGGKAPSSADLCDFDDARRSLEVRFASIMEDHAN